jgi:hypothetical protein
MAANETAAALIGAGIGAGGAVLAQVVASIFTGRRDTERLRWEQARQDREERLRREERFIELKRELYGRYLTMVNKIWDFVVTVPRDKSAIPDMLELQRIQTDLDLIAPGDLAKKTREARLMLIAVVKVVEQIPSEHHVGEAVFEQTRVYIGEARSAMQTDLRGGPPPSSH